MSGYETFRFCPIYCHALAFVSWRAAFSLRDPLSSFITDSISPGHRERVKGGSLVQPGNTWWPPFSSIWINVVKWSSRFWLKLTIISRFRRGPVGLSLLMAKDNTVTASDRKDHEESSDIFMWYPMVSDAYISHLVDVTSVSLRTEIEAPFGKELGDGSRRTDLDAEDWVSTGWKWDVCMVRHRMNMYRHDVDMASVLGKERHTWPKTRRLFYCKNVNAKFKHFFFWSNNLTQWKGVHSIVNSVPTLPTNGATAYRPIFLRSTISLWSSHTSSSVHSFIFKIFSILSVFQDFSKISWFLKVSKDTIAYTQKVE